MNFNSMILIPIILYFKYSADQIFCQIVALLPSLC